MDHTKMTTELKPCPFCGEPVEARVLQTTLMVIIECEKCGISTRYFMDNESCVKYWNDRIESPLQWTKTPPTEEYLHRMFVVRYKLHGEPYERLATLQFNHEPKLILFNNPFMARIDQLVCLDAEFYGPLPE